MKLESRFQSDLISELKVMFPGIVIFKQDEQARQGIPDLLLLIRERWAMLECKRSIFSKYQPNQEYYLDKFDRMGFAAMICPENKEQVLDALQQSFGV